MNNLSIKIIGLGGIGSQLIENLCQFLHYYKIGLSSDDNFAQQMGINNPPQFDEISITLIDGDKYEPKNRTRQLFSRVGPKADIKKEDLIEKYDSLSYYTINEYINEENISNIISDYDVVFMCVDNHKTRKIVNDYCKTLNNIFLISAGNGFHLFNCQIYIKINNEEQKPNLTKYHPEIENAEDKLPSEMGCEELSKSEPQLIFANWGAAFLMARCFYVEYILGYKMKTSDLYGDLISGNILAKEFPI